MASLFELTSEYQALMDLGDSSDPEDRQAFLDTLEGLDFEVGLKADSYAAVITLLTGKADTIDNEIKRLSVIKKAIDDNVHRMKDALQHAMEVMDKSEIKTDLHSFKICKNGGKLPLIVRSEDVPDQYMRVIYEVDNDLIRAALDKGHELDFAYYGERGTHLRIR